jgi:hypothetical protein
MVFGTGVFRRELEVDEIMLGTPWWHSWLYKKRKRHLSWQACSVSLCDAFCHVPMQQKGPHQTPNRYQHLRLLILQSQKLHKPLVFINYPVHGVQLQLQNTDLDQDS